jgi:hypothetical protein
MEFRNFFRLLQISPFNQATTTSFQISTNVSFWASLMPTGPIWRNLTENLRGGESFPRSWGIRELAVFKNTLCDTTQNSRANFIFKFCEDHGRSPWTKKREKCIYIRVYSLIRHYALTSTFKVHLYSPTCFGDRHHHHRGRQHHRPHKHRYHNVSICSCKHRYTARAP